IMAKVLKTLTNPLKRIHWKRDRDVKQPLVSGMTELVNAPEKVQCYASDDINPLADSRDSGTDPYIQALDSQDEGQKVLSVLADILLGDLGSQEQPAEQVKQWAKRNGITPGGKKGSYSQNWLTDYLEIVDMSVEKHFPIRPPEGPRDSYQKTLRYLNSALRSVRREVFGLTPVLEDAGLLSYLVDSYNRRLLAVLEVLMDRSSSVEETFLLLHWAKQTYFSHGFKDSSNIQDGVIRVSDPLLLTHWFEKSKQKLLILIQRDISNMLQNILQYNETPCDYKNEEDFIKVYLDVIQCLNATRQQSKIFSQILMDAVQRLCFDELHIFVQRYVKDEKKRLETQKSRNTYSLQDMYRIINTCKHIRSYAFDLMDSNNDTDISTVLVLENMEGQVLSIIQELFADLAEDKLKKYFKQRDTYHINILLGVIKKMLEPLPQMEQGKGTKQCIVNVTYQIVTGAYLRCLMQSKRDKMEKIWGAIDRRMTTDAQRFHCTFSELSISDDKQKEFLNRMSDILRHNDINYLKSLGQELYSSFPKESEEHLHAMLKWKGLSKRQIREILDVRQEAYEDGGHVTPRRLTYWSYCLCCT
ncbi:hypothetical protein NFI96_017626, partial [Prochilodus magdalenae]